MRFEPRVIPGDEPPTDAAGQLLLPDDLQVLAAQLCDDAAHLTACFPAESSGQWQVTSATAAGDTTNASKTRDRKQPRRRRWAIVGTSLVSLSLLVGATAVYWSRSGVDPQTETARRSVSSPVQQGDASDIAEARGLEARPQTAIADPGETPEFPAAEAELSPVLFLQNVSAPELEGLYDLIELDRSGADAGDVSI